MWYVRFQEGLVVNWWIGLKWFGLLQSPGSTSGYSLKILKTPTPTTNLPLVENQREIRRPKSWTSTWGFQSRSGWDVPSSFFCFNLAWRWLENHLFWYVGDTTSNGSFSIVTLVFRGVCFMVLLVQFHGVLHFPITQTFPPTTTTFTQTF